MTKIEKFVLAIVTVLSVSAFIFWKDIRFVAVGQAEVGKVKSNGGGKNDRKEKNDKEGEETTHTDITIVQKWEMPPELKEISGIAYINENRFACVQDELGKIFIYNTASRKVEEVIDFAGTGDYEGISIVGSTAYIQRADGKIFEVKNYDSEPSVIEHNTHLTAKQDVEGLAYDKKNNRLLLAIKGKEANNNEYKGIYAFDLSSKQMETKPAYKIDLTHAIWNNVKSKNKIQPTDLEVHPATGDLYIIDGPGPQLLVMGGDGSKKKLYQLNSSDFSQPEGIAFTQKGELFISNEGRTGPGNILRVSVGSKL